MIHVFSLFSEAIDHTNFNLKYCPWHLCELQVDFVLLFLALNTTERQV